MMLLVLKVLATLVVAVVKTNGMPSSSLATTDTYKKYITKT